MSIYKKSDKSPGAKHHINFERILYTSFFIVFFVLILTQTAMFIPSLNSAMIEKDTQNGVPISEEEYLYKKGTLVLTLLDFENYQALKVLVNGEERAAFFKNTLNINVIDGDVVELDGSETNANTTVAVSSISKNIDEEYLGKTFIIGREVLKIFKIRLSS